MNQTFTEYTEDDCNSVMNTNVASYFFMTQQVVPQMKKQNSGNVVNISAIKCFGSSPRTFPRFGQAQKVS
jgi:NADP-dependent 3-hydroxy acid dehydrogenase YdfG